MTIGPVPLCYHCARLTGFFRCAAFPNGIPFDIVSWTADHHMPYPGDDGKVYVEERDKYKSIPEDAPITQTVGDARMYYDPNQPRVPAGSPGGGQWTSEDGGGWASSESGKWTAEAGSGTIVRDSAIADQPEATKHKLGHLHENEAALVRDELIRRTKETGLEHAMMWDKKNGAMIADVQSGSENRIEIDPKIGNIMSDPDQDIAFHHTHPSGGTFSIQDMITAHMSPGVSEFWAHGDEGSHYQIIKGSREVSEQSMHRLGVSGQVADHVIAETFKEAIKDGGDRYVSGYKDIILYDARTGEPVKARERIFTAEGDHFVTELDMMHQHAVLTAMADTGLFKYNYQQSPKWRAPVEKHSALFQKAVANATVAITSAFVNPKFVWGPGDITVTYPEDQKND